ncbi:DDE-type integrase/transposase/recombinase [Bacillus paramycoides]|uniref:DDE-type integrase/transposase/recombinase n=1 Tax=Bacillus paramycoides TaxID=2026194 RepID=A0ABU6N1Y7_9BACI|nr:DDE-type integrase/transposase/recombinase [Bacillus paramycoides]
MRDLQDEHYEQLKIEKKNITLFFMKKRVRSMLGLNSFRTATSIISGIEAMHMVKKGQLVLLDKSVQNQVKFIHQLFGMAA